MSRIYVLLSKECACGERRAFLLFVWKSYQGLNRIIIITVSDIHPASSSPPLNGTLRELKSGRQRRTFGRQEIISGALCMCVRTSASSY